MSDVLRKTQVWEFVRNMDYTNGRAFTLTWGETKLNVDPHSEQNQMIVESLTWQPSIMHPALHRQLKRKLVMLAGEFQEDVFLLLQCLLDAARGDYELLATFAKEFEVLPSKAAHSYYFDHFSEEQDAA